MFLFIKFRISCVLINSSRIDILIDWTSPFPNLCLLGVTFIKVLREYS